MKKKVLSVLLASAMVFSLAACGNKSEGDSAAADTRTMQQPRRQPMTQQQRRTAPLMQAESA